MSNIQYRHPLNYNPTALFPFSEGSSIIELIYRNIMREDNCFTGVLSIPGAIIASPSIPADPETDQNYTYDWIRDSAVTMYEVIEIAKNDTYSEWRSRLTKVIKNYISFTEKVQNNSSNVTLGYARWNLDGTPSKYWTVQNDGPALRIISHILAINSGQISEQTRNQAIKNIKKDLDYIFNTQDYQCINIWEEVYGDHFFTKKILRRAFFDCKSNGIYTENVTAAKIDESIERLEKRMEKHIQGRGYFKSNIAADAGDKKGNDKNIDVLFSLLYGEIGKNPIFSINTEKSIATTAAIVKAFVTEYPINNDDISIGLGPNLGRYPFDNYDGDTEDGYNIGHPWFISGNALACFFYKIASIAHSDTNTVQHINLHFSDLYKQKIDSANDIVTLGDRHILTTKRHWAACHMSEQYDRNTGYMKSVRDLTWSYATYLMAMRLRP